MSNDNQNLKVYVSRGKALLMVVFVLTGLVVMYSTLVQAVVYLPSEINSFLSFINVFVYFFLVAIALFVTRKLIVFLKFLFSPTLLITVNQEGLTFPRIGLIPWENIDSMEVHQLKLLCLPVDRRLQIFLKDPESYLSRFKPVKRMIWQKQIQSGFAPLTVNGNLLPMSADQLLEKINEIRSQQAHLA